MPILLWLFGGSFLANIAIGVVAAALAGGAGYIKGRMDCANAAQVAALHSQVKQLTRQLEDRDWLDEFSRELALDAADLDQKNLVTDRVVKDEIDRAPTVDGCATPAFLDRVRLYK